MTRQQVYEFFANFGIETGVKHEPISHRKFVTIVKTARQWYGFPFAQFVFDCFVPVGEVSNGVPEEWMPDMPLEEEEVDHEESS